jgi:dTDP-4-amino-4,6-dideoxygalactose transaminase
MSKLTAVLPNIPQMLPGAFFEAHREEILAAMTRVLDSGWYILGREVRSFEEEFAAHFGFGAAVGVANGTDAIELALRCLGVGRGDLVATPSHTAVATAAAIEAAGALPVFVEIDPETYAIDPSSLERTVREVPGIKAVIAVHLYGHPADMPAVLEIARKSGLYVIEDCAQAQGTRLGGRFAGSMGDVATFSFYPTKNLGALGDGGMVVTGDQGRARTVSALREYGWEQRYVSERPGINSRLDELQAAILRIRLPYLEEGNRRRAAIASAYDCGLAGSGLVLPVCRPGAEHTYHQYVIRHPERAGFLKRLKQSGVSTNIHYPMGVHRQPAYAGRCAIDPAGLTLTETVASQVVSLPMYPELTDDDVATSIDAIRKSI